MIAWNREVRFEQAVYGSFSFWHRGYDVLARSSGCRVEWVSALKSVCQGYGERPTGAVESDALFAIRLDRGPWMIVGVFPQGCDDRGRPGALAFHALFVDRWTYASVGADPFAFTDLLRSDWSAAEQDAILPDRPRTIRRARFRRCRVPDPADERLLPIVRALMQGRRVVVQSTEPIDSLARDVWRALPWHVRLRTSVATWAFDNANRFDLAAFPKLTGLQREPTDLVLSPVAEPR
jgi:hypothetical protein